MWTCPNWPGYDYALLITHQHICKVWASPDLSLVRYVVTLTSFTKYGNSFVACDVALVISLYWQHMALAVKGLYREPVTVFGMHTQNDAIDTDEAGQRVASLAFNMLLHKLICCM